MPPFNLLRLDHVVLRVADLDRALDFYVGSLGCAVEKVQEKIGLTQLRAGDSLIDLVPVDGELGRQGGPPPGADGHNMDHLCLRVDPFEPDGLVQHFRARGIAVTRDDIVSRYGAEGQGPSLYISDPDGNTVELKGPPDGA